MLTSILLGFGALLAILFLYIGTRSGRFRYVRSGLMKAPPEKIYPYLCDFRLGAEWSPYEKTDKTMKKQFWGEFGQIGSVMIFEGNTNSGAGRIEILRMVPNESVDLRLTMKRPFEAENLVRYELKREAEGTRFTWIMQGEGGYMSKVINFFVDCEKLVAGQFEVGIAQLKFLLDGGLNENHEVMYWPETHYLFIEKKGPFSETAGAAWQELHAKLGALSSPLSIEGMMSLYRLKPEMVYRAGAILKEVPAQIPEGFQYEHFQGGRYARFLLAGSYSQLPEASGRVMDLAEQRKFKRRDGFYIENYPNDPAKTPEAELRTEIHVPII